MKKLQLSILLLAAWLMPVLAYAQPSPGPKGMDDLSFLVGDWEGKGWQRSGNGGTREFVQRVSTRAYMGGEILVSEQTFIDKSGPESDGFSVVIIYSFDAGTKKLVARSMLSKGRDRIVGIRVEDGGFSWPNRDVGGRYLTSISEDGHLVTTGFYPNSEEQYFETVLMPVAEYQAASVD